MAILRISEIRKLNPSERDKKLHELEMQLIKYRSKILAGGELVNPSLIKEIRKTIARIKTINHENYLKSLQSSD